MHAFYLGYLYIEFEHNFIGGFYNWLVDLLSRCFKNSENYNDQNQEGAIDCIEEVDKIF